MVSGMNVNVVGKRYEMLNGIKYYFIKYLGFIKKVVK